MRFSGLLIAAVVLATSLSGMARAGSYATFVSGTGVDSGACTEAAPCATFEFALKQTRPGGVITAVSPGSFGPVRITSPVSIVADGVTALIEATAKCGSSSAAICILATGDITLRGLAIDLHQTSATTVNGIQFNGAGALHVQKCRIRETGSSGIDFDPASASSLYISDTALTDNQADGIVVSVSANGNSNATFDRVRVENNGGNGLAFGNGSGALNGVVRNSVFAGNDRGVVANSVGGAGLNLTLDRVTVAMNNPYGILAPSTSGSSTIVQIGNTTIVGNATGVLTFAGASTLSFGTNKLVANGTDGSFTGTVAPQ